MALSNFKGIVRAGPGRTPIRIDFVELQYSSQSLLEVQSKGAFEQIEASVLLQTKNPFQNH
jgi:hypothetical protein